MHQRIPRRDPGRSLEHLHPPLGPAGTGKRLAHYQQELDIAFGLGTQLLGDGTRLFDTVQPQKTAREPSQGARLAATQASRLREALQCLAVQAPQQEDLTHD